MCNCHGRINAKLKEKNARLVTGFHLAADSIMKSLPPIIALEKIDTSKRGKPPILIATYCPFCGERFPP